jgi:hypothetical protein
MRGRGARARRLVENEKIPQIQAYQNISPQSVLFFVRPSHGDVLALGPANIRLTTRASWLLRGTRAREVVARHEGVERLARGFSESASQKSLRGFKRSRVDRHGGGGGGQGGGPRGGRAGSFVSNGV